MKKFEKPMIKISHFANEQIVTLSEKNPTSYELAQNWLAENQVKVEHVIGF